MNATLHESRGRQWWAVHITPSPTQFAEEWGRFSVGVDSGFLGPRDHRWVACLAERGAQ